MRVRMRVCVIDALLILHESSQALDEKKNKSGRANRCVREAFQAAPSIFGGLSEMLTGIQVDNDTEGWMDIRMMAVQTDVRMGTPSYRDARKEKESEKSESKSCVGFNGIKETSLESQHRQKRKKKLHRCFPLV